MESGVDEGKRSSSMPHRVIGRTRADLEGAPVTAPREAVQAPAHVKADWALLLPLAYRLARMTDTPSTLPPTTPPFTPAMAQALERG
jgi:hypothetical protein